LKNNSPEPLITRTIAIVSNNGWLLGMKKVTGLFPQSFCFCNNDSLVMRGQVLSGFMEC
jgi:hypothetical protein